MDKVKEIFLWVGGLLALIGSVWLGVIAAAGGRGRRLGGAGVGAGAAPDQGSPQDLTAQFVEAAERAMGQIDRRSDELR
ncbi:MAG: hypothetical protein ACYC9Q_00005, partial [Bacillota bacterium]